MAIIARHYRSYVLCLLLAGYVLDSLDRSILGVLLQPIKFTFGLSDTQLGLLGGLAFAALYSTTGLVAGFWADRTKATRILVLSMLIWSSMTVLCGLAATFGLLLLARMGTALGESGANPASQSILATFFTSPRRATAFGIFALGAPAGAMLGSALGGFGNSHLGWRVTLMAAGIPGILLAILIFFTVRDQPRPAAVPLATRCDPPNLGNALRLLSGKSSFRHLSLACGLHSVAVYSAASFNGPFLMRSGWDSSHTGALLAMNGGFGVLGALLGGALADRLERLFPGKGWMLRIAALASLALVPVEVTLYLAGGSILSIVGLMFSGFFSSVFFGPSFAATQNLAGRDMRATAASVLVFIKTLIGMGVGPLLVGSLSDWLRPVVGYQSLRYALLATAFFNLWSVAHFWFSARSYDKDSSEPASGPLRVARGRFQNA
jgi:predicted MFS family arabinose efflux permease